MKRVPFWFTLRYFPPACFQWPVSGRFPGPSLWSVSRAQSPGLFLDQASCRFPGPSIQSASRTQYPACFITQHPAIFQDPVSDSFHGTVLRLVSGTLVSNRFPGPSLILKFTQNLMYPHTYHGGLSSLAESPECWNLEFKLVQIFADNFLIFTDKIIYLR